MTWLTLYLFSLCLCISTGAEESLRLNILVVGRTGSGKSTLINNILGREVAKVGHGINPQTSTASVYQEMINGVDVTVCDTPGLKDSTGQDDKYIQKIKASCGDPDLVIFCHKMDNTRWHSDDEETIKLVTKHFGPSIWTHSLLVLTFADKIYSGDGKTEDDFIERRKELEDRFAKSLSENGVSNYVLLSAVTAKGIRDLPGVPDWKAEFFTACLNLIIISNPRAKALFRIISLRLKDPSNATEEDFKKPEHEQPIFTTPRLLKLLKLTGIVVGTGIAGGSLFGPIGWTAGAIGAIGAVTAYSLDYIQSLIFPEDSEEQLSKESKTEL